MLRAAEFGSNHLYPSSDGKPMAESDRHRDQMASLIDILSRRYHSDPQVYVSGNLLVYYEAGNKRRRVAPDCFVVFGVEKKSRLNYLVWEEGKSPAVVFELTSSSTKAEDTKKKFALYRDVLKVREYFLFDPYEDYLKPSLQGYRLRGGIYHPIKPVKYRIPSNQLGLHLESNDQELRLWDPETESRLPTRDELFVLIRAGFEAEKLRAATARANAEKARAESAEARADAEKAKAEAAIEELVRLLEQLAMQGITS